MIRYFRNSNIWNFKTKLIILYSNRKDINDNIVDLLLEFSAAGIFNVAILLPRIHHRPCTFIYHNLFTPTPRNGYFYVAKNPKSIEDGFPNKVKNLYGYQFNLIVVPAPPHVILKGNQVYGTRKYLFDIVLKRWNATYRHVIEATGSLEKYSTFHLHNLFYNNVPFFNLKAKETYDIHPAYMQDQYRIMLKYRQLTNVNVIKGSHFLICFCVLYFLAFLLYKILFKNVRNVGEFRTKWIHFIGISLRQHSNLIIETNIPARLYYYSIFLFSFFILSVLECLLTSQIVAYTPQKSISNMDELLKSNITIFGNFWQVYLIRGGKYNLSGEMLNRFEVSSDHPWDDNVHNRDNEAFLVTTTYNSFFLKSALNQNKYGRAKFYLLDYVIATFPLMNVFPKFSPFQDEFTKIYSRLIEAGLPEYWLTKTLDKSVWEKWRTSNVVLQKDIMQYNLNKLMFVFPHLAIAWGLCFVVFALELLVYHIPRQLKRITKVKPKTKIIVKKPRHNQKKYRRHLKKLKNVKK